MKINITRLQFKVGASMLIAFSTIATRAMAEELPATIKQALDQASVAEDNSLTGPSDKTVNILMNYMRGNWFSVLAHLNEVAPTDDKKIVLARAAESLGAKDYLKFLERIRDLRQSGAINQRVFEQAGEPSHYKEGFLAINYQNREVRKYIESIRPLTQSKWQGDWNEILSGQRKKDLERRWAGNHDGPDESTLILAVSGEPTKAK
jgi:hypothetical protein